MQPPAGGATPGDHAEGDRSAEPFIFKAAPSLDELRTVFSDSPDPAASDAPPSQTWLAAWRQAHTALVTHCHTRDALHLSEFQAHARAMHAVDPARTRRELDRMLDENRPEWDPSDRVPLPDLTPESS